MSKEQHLF